MTSIECPVPPSPAGLLIVQGEGEHSTRFLLIAQALFLSFYSYAKSKIVRAVEVPPPSPGASHGGRLVTLTDEAFSLGRYKDCFDTVIFVSHSGPLDGPILNYGHEGTNTNTQPWGSDYQFDYNVARASGRTTYAARDRYPAGVLTASWPDVMHIESGRCPERMAVFQPGPLGPPKLT